MSPTSKYSETQKALVALSLEKFATTLRADFRFSPLNVLLLVAIFVIGLFVHLAVHPFRFEAVVLCLGSALALVSLVQESGMPAVACRISPPLSAGPGKAASSTASETVSTGMTSMRVAGSACRARK